MPLWRIFHAPNLYTPDEKAAFAQAITKRYASLPDFYVNVIFTAVEASDLYIAGKSRDNFVRIVITQIARHFEGDTQRMASWMAGVEETIEPWVKAKAQDWEVHIDETSRELWRVQGFVPPAQDSEGEKLWKDGGRPVPYE